MLRSVCQQFAYYDSTQVVQKGTHTHSHLLVFTCAAHRNHKLRSVISLAEAVNEKDVLNLGSRTSPEQ